MIPRAYKATYTVDQFREVWALVTKEPTVSINRLSEKVSIPRWTVIAILKRMKAIGLLEHPVRNARIIKVPMDTRR